MERERARIERREKGGKARVKDRERQGGLGRRSEAKERYVEMERGLGRKAGLGKKTGRGKVGYGHTQLPPPPSSSRPPPSLVFPFLLSPLAHSPLSAK